MAPPVLDGLGSQPLRLVREATLSTALCVCMVTIGLAPAMPHPQHDHVAAHFIVVVLAFATLLKAATFVWCYFPALTGAYPVVGVSLIQWCGCMSHEEEMEEMEQNVAEGTADFYRKARSSGSRQSDRQDSNRRRRDGGRGGGSTGYNHSSMH